MVLREQRPAQSSPRLSLPSLPAAEARDHILIDITTTRCPDPWLTVHESTYFLTFTGNDLIPLWSHSSLLSFNSDSPDKSPLWIPPSSGPISERLWAPELHAIRGRWYLYFAAADREMGNRSHRMYVLRGPSSERNPREEGWEWELAGSLQGMDQRQWAIDGTVFELGERLFFVYSGWPWKTDGGGRWEESDERCQELWILELEDPETVKEGCRPVRISTPEWEWECLGDIGINEGPQWLEGPDGCWKGLVYSAGPSWTKHYKMATLQLVGEDPMRVESWKKGLEPLLQNRPDGVGPYGPGHGCFLHIGARTFAFFHAVDVETDTWNRNCRMQEVIWGADGPDMGGYVGVRKNMTVDELIRART